MQGVRLEQIRETKKAYRAYYIALMVFASYFNAQLLLDGVSLCFESNEYIKDVAKDVAGILLACGAAEYCNKLIEDFDKYKNVGNSNVRVRNRKI